MTAGLRYLAVSYAVATFLAVLPYLLGRRYLGAKIGKELAAVMAMQDGKTIDDVKTLPGYQELLDKSNGAPVAPLAAAVATRSRQVEMPVLGLLFILVVWAMPVPAFSGSGFSALWSIALGVTLSLMATRLLVLSWIEPSRVMVEQLHHEAFTRQMAPDQIDTVWQAIEIFRLNHYVSGLHVRDLSRELGLAPTLDPPPRNTSDENAPPH